MMKTAFVSILGILSFIYLLNPTWGVFEILPDNLPLVGNIDEALAMAILLGALRYHGIDVTRFFRDRSLDFGERMK